LCYHGRGSSEEARAVQEAGSMTEETIDPEHIEWLVENRAKNQKTAAKLFKLLDEHSDEIRKRNLVWAATALVGVAFSLWRAAFLADKRGTKREITLNAAKDFLGGMLRDNVIAFSQDRRNREWTFNYYIQNALDRLNQLDVKWPGILRGKPDSWTTEERWEYHQLVFDRAVNRLARDLTRDA